MGVNMTGEIASATYLPLGGGTVTGTLTITGTQIFNDDVLLKLGTTSDQVLLNRSTTLNANTAVTSVLVGTPVTPALAANSLIISNITTDGDILIAASDGGHSRTALFFDASTPDTYLYNVGGTWTAGATAWTIPAHTLGGAVAGGDQSFTNVGDMTFAAGSILASGGTNTNTLLIRANDTTFITLTTAATDVCTMDAITMSGTWLASGTVTLPAFTLGGTITGGSQLLNSLGHIGIGVDTDVRMQIRTGETFTDTTNAFKTGVYAFVTLQKTTAAYTNYVAAGEFSAVVGGTNTQNWTNAVGLRGVASYLGASGTGTITGAAHFYVAPEGLTGITVTNLYGLLIPDAGGTATVTNQYGIYIAAMTEGATLNWGIYNLSKSYLTAVTLGGYLTLFKTDTDSAVEAELWYDDSENVLKYYNGTAVKTLAVVA